MSDLDRVVCSPLYGWEDVEAYWQQASQVARLRESHRRQHFGCRGRRLSDSPLADPCVSSRGVCAGDINVPFLVLQALDDPVFTNRVSGWECWPCMGCDSHCQAVTVAGVTPRSVSGAQRARRALV